MHSEKIARSSQRTVTPHTGPFLVHVVGAPKNLLFWQILSILYPSLTTVPALCSRPLDRLIPQRGHFVPYGQRPPFPHLPIPGNHSSTLYFCVFNCSRFHSQVRSCSFSHSVWLVSLSIMSSGFFCVENGRISFFLKTDSYPSVHTPCDL